MHFARPKLCRSSRSVSVSERAFDRSIGSIRIGFVQRNAAQRSAAQLSRSVASVRFNLGAQFARANGRCRRRRLAQVNSAGGGAIGNGRRSISSVATSRLRHTHTLMDSLMRSHANSSSSSLKSPFTCAAAARYRNATLRNARLRRTACLVCAVRRFALGSVLRAHNLIICVPLSLRRPNAEDRSSVAGLAKNGNVQRQCARARN